MKITLVKMGNFLSSNYVQICQYYIQQQPFYDTKYLPCYRQNRVLTTLHVYDLNLLLAGLKIYIESPSLYMPCKRHLHLDLDRHKRLKYTIIFVIDGTEFKTKQNQILFESAMCAQSLPANTSTLTLASMSVTYAK